MFIIEATRRASRTAATRVMNALVEYDQIVFKDVSVEASPKEAFQVVKDGRTYAVAFNDPSVPECVPDSWGPEADEWVRDCGD